MSKIEPNFSKGLKRARKNAGYKTQQDFADAIHKSLNAIQKWEQGKTFPSLGEFIDLCQFFNCDADYLLGNIENVTHDLDFVCKYTGLSAEAIENLHSDAFVSESKDFISCLISEYGDGKKYHDLYSYIEGAADSQVLAFDIGSKKEQQQKTMLSNHLKANGVNTKDASNTKGIEIIGAHQATDFKLSEAARIFREFAMRFVLKAAQKRRGNNGK